CPPPSMGPIMNLTGKLHNRLADAHLRCENSPKSGQVEAPMCRNIKPLFNFEPPATPDEVRASALQFVRKISGFSHPSHANEAAFEEAVEEITAVARKMLKRLETNAPPRSREVEAAKARERARLRFPERYVKEKEPA